MTGRATGPTEAEGVLTVDGAPDPGSMVLRHAPAMIAYLDADLRYVFANDQYARLVGCQRDQLAGLHVADVVRFYDEVNPGLKAALAGVPQHCEFKSWHDDPRWLRVDITPDRSPSGTVRGLFVFAIDIHEQRSAQESTETFRYAMDQGVDGFSIHDEYGRFLYANPAFAQIYGYTVDELVGRPWTIQHDEAWCRYVETQCIRTLVRDGRWSGELEGRRKNGDSFPVEVSMTVTRDDDGEITGSVCTCRDLTDQKVAEESLRHLRKMDVLGKLTGGAAHDFNNLLLIINSELEMALEQQSSPHERLSSIRHALDAAKKAAALTQRLLSFLHNRSLQPRIFNPGRLVDEMASLLRRTLGENIVVRIESEPEPWLCRADHDELENLILNLAINARDAMPDGGALTIRTTNVPAEKPDDIDFVRIEVEDTGTGMPPETLTKIFDPFFTTKVLGEGSGLGLSMGYGFAHQSGGSLSATSMIGQGSVFTLDLPRAKRQRNEDAITSAHNASATTSAVEMPAISGSTILLVEDDDEVRRSVSRMLTKLDAEVIEADGPAAADEILATYDNVDLLLSDVVLAGTRTGVDVAVAARHRHPGLPVVLMSGYRGDLVSGVVDGAYMLPKPFSFGQLTETVCDALSQHA